MLIFLEDPKPEKFKFYGRYNLGKRKKRTYQGRWLEQLALVVLLSILK